MTDKKHYRNYPEDALYSDEYMDHVSAMTREELHSKSDIALELAYRDLRVKELEGKIKELEEEAVSFGAMYHRLDEECNRLYEENAVLKEVQNE